MHTQVYEHASPRRIVYGVKMASGSLVVSAPGKVILYGEHAVVYGKAALATSVDLRCYLVLSQTVDGAVTLDLADFGHRMTWSLSTFTHWPESNESRMAYLKELSGSLSDSPPTQNVAALVFLYLLTHICREKLREFQGLHATVLSTLPYSAGLGSSAAFSVSVAAGLLSLVGGISSTHRQQAIQQPEDECSDENLMPRQQSVGITLPQPILERLHSLGIKLVNSESDNGGMSTGLWSVQELEIVNEWGLEAEKLTHGTPSGIDNSISTFGGAIKFHSGQIHHLQKMPKLRILLVNTKVLRSTKMMVAGVRDLHTKYPNVVSPILESIEAIAQRAELLLNKLGMISSTISPTHSSEEDPSDEVLKIYSGLQDLLVVNQQLLNAIGVGHKALNQVCGIAQERGMGAKLTGAGGGGCAIVLIPPGFSEAVLTEVKQALVTAGFDCFETTVGSNGISLHNIST